MSTCKFNFTKTLVIILVFIALFCSVGEITSTALAEEVTASDVNSKEQQEECKFSNEWFSFSYPAYMEKEINPKLGTITLSNKDESVVIKMEKIVENAPTLKSSDFLMMQERIVEKLKQGGNTFISGISYSFRGYPGRKLKLENLGSKPPVKMELILFQKDTNIYLFGYFAQKEIYYKQLPIYNKIINSVVFAD